MPAFVLRRLLGSLPVLLLVAVVLFFLLQVAPGDPVDMMLREHVDAEVAARARADLRLDEPLPARCLAFLASAARGDLGVSYKLQRPVAELLLSALPNTFALAGLAVVLAWLMGIPAGIAAARAPGGRLDKLIETAALSCVSTPVFWTALVLQWLFAVKLGLLPVSGLFEWRGLILPALTLAIPAAGAAAMLARNGLTQAMASDYARTALSQGLGRTAVLVRVCFKNAAAPLVAVMALQAGSLLSGAVITETVFAIPGLGRLGVDAVMARDMPLLQGAVLAATLIVILGNLAGDLVNAVIDPRVSRGEGGKR